MHRARFYGVLLLILAGAAAAVGYGTCKRRTAPRGSADSDSETAASARQGATPGGTARGLVVPRTPPGSGGAGAEAPNHPGGSQEGTLADPLKGGRHPLQTFSPSASPRKTPIAENEAAALFKDLAFGVQPTLNPETTFSLEAVEVEGLWRTLGLELFRAKYNFPGGVSWRRASVVFDGSGLAQLTDASGQQITVTSGVVVGRAFYVSWTSGIGIRRAHVGRITRDTDLALTESPAYRFDTPPFDFAVRELRGAVVVERAWATGFNAWENGHLFGKVLDDGSRLAIVDQDDREIAPEM
jgi:hypothetical protein